MFLKLIVLQPFLSYCSFRHSDERIQKSFRKYKNTVLTDNCNILCNSKQHNTYHCINLPSAEIHAFWFKVLQLVLVFYSSYLKKVLKLLSFGSQTHITSNGHICVGCCQGNFSHLCWSVPILSYNWLIKDT